MQNYEPTDRRSLDVGSQPEAHQIHSLKMEEEKFLIKVIFFKRVMKCIKDHQCFFCGEKISTGSSYFISTEPDPKTGYHLKCCEKCFDERLERPIAVGIGKAIDR